MAGHLERHAELGHSIKEFHGLTGLNPYVEEIENGERVWSQASDRETIATKTFWYSYQPATSVPTTTLSAASTQVNINVDNPNILADTAVLQINVSESGGSNSVTPTLAPLFVEKIRWTQDGSGVKQEQWGDSLSWLQYMKYPTEKLQNIVAVENANTSYAGPQLIAASGTATYWIPLTGCFLEQNPVLLSALRGRIQCQIYFRDSDEAGSGVLATSSVILHIRGHEVLTAEQQHIRSLYDDKIEMHFLNTVRIDNTQTYAPSTTYNLQLNAFNGLFAAVIGGFRSSMAATSGGLRTFTDPGASALFSITNADGNSVIGANDMRYDHIRYIHSSALETNHGNLLNTVPLIPFYFTDFESGFVHRKKNGFLPISNREYFKAVLPASWSSATYTLSVVGFYWVHAHIERGIIMPFKQT